MSKSSLSQFRFIALLEGVSYLVLLFIAMPLKYILNMPLLVKYTGWAHGLLFIAYFILLVIVYFDRKWPFSRMVLAGIASLIPFGTFYLDSKYLKKEAQGE